MALGYEPSIEELMDAMNPPKPDEKAAGSISLQTEILLDILKTVTRIEDELEEEEEVTMEDFRDVPAFTTNTNPITDAILMSNPAQS